MPLQEALNVISSVDKLRASVDQWTERCAQQAGIADLSLLERKAMVRIGLSDEHTRFSSLCFELSVKDQHLVTYALRKLERHSVIVKRKIGKEVEYKLTELGKDSVVKYCRLLSESYDFAGILPRDRMVQWRSFVRELTHGFDDAARYVVVKDLTEALDYA